MSQYAATITVFSNVKQSTFPNGSWTDERNKRNFTEICQNEQGETS